MDLWNVKNVKEKARKLVEEREVEKQEIIKHREKFFKLLDNAFSDMQESQR